MGNRHHTMIIRSQPKTSLLIGLVAVLSLAVGLTGCGDDAGNPESKLTLAQATERIPDAPAPLRRVRAQANQLLPGGTTAFEERISDLRGYPIVVNKWASWCGPCRFEFPLFQQAAIQYGESVGFIGVDSDDAEAPASTFLQSLPLPYPSYLDPNSEIADLIKAPTAFPATAFFDRRGRLVHLKQGVYSDEQELIADIERWAR